MGIIASVKMLISEQKPLEEILSYLNGEKNIFLLGCGGCAEGCESGGERQVLEMKSVLEEKGKVIVGFSVIDMVCNEKLTGMKLKAHQKELEAADSVLALTCGIGVQTAAGVADKMVHPGCNTLSSGGAHAEWKDAERCLECGECMLEFSGGICPIARCSKHLLNGPCGGSQGGKCEVDPSIPCAWQSIIERLTKLGKLERLEGIVEPKKWKASLVAGLPVKR